MYLHKNMNIWCLITKTLAAHIKKPIVSKISVNVLLVEESTTHLLYNISATEGEFV